MSAKLHFRYGTMGSGKSMDLLKVAYNYEETGKKILIASPVIGNRVKANLIGSRIGWARSAMPIYIDTNIRKEVADIVEDTGTKIHCVLIDEAQFLIKEQVIQLTEIVDKLGIPVMAFGLKNDFRNELFEGSYHLLAQAEEVEEIKTICSNCDRSAFMVARFEDGFQVRDGEQIVIDNEENRNKQITYKPVCRKCYNKGS
jgi:thymidine kinase